MSPVPQGTAELIAHIFQPSLRDSEVVSCNLRRAKKAGMERKSKNSRYNLSRSSSTNNLLFVWPIAPQWNQPTTSSNNLVSR
jgi:hypothetical protein